MVNAAGNLKKVAPDPGGIREVERMLRARSFFMH
jgi:hypothetical protein